MCSKLSGYSVTLVISVYIIIKLWQNVSDTLKSAVEAPTCKHNNVMETATMVYRHAPNYAMSRQYNYRRGSH